ncbi:hypothetical protein CP532_6230 [Ophiocordyceps camponoti-leonardi (nom. inval.)]|nr:hypothetical protein CP532_6230 [Ophiocordyceps camponoti-leonardi (nom. inval.)]
MLLLHQTGSLKVGELARYTISYKPCEDGSWPKPESLHLRIVNTCPTARRVAVYPGPFTLSANAYPTVFDPYAKLSQPEEYGVPRFEPQVKAGSGWECELAIPSWAFRPDYYGDVSWVVEVSSQAVFAKSAVVGYELLVASDEQVMKRGLIPDASPGRLVEHQDVMRETEEPSSLQSSGVFSTAVKIKVEDTALLWRSPPMGGKKKSDLVNEATTKKRNKKKRIHLVVLTHGLNSAIGADLLFLKEAIDGVAKKRKKSKSNNNEEDEDEEDEQIIVRGYSGNATKTQRGIKFLGTRVAKYVLAMTYPDQPYLPTGRTAEDGFAQGFAGDLDPRHQHAHPYMPHEYHQSHRQSYQVTSISFIGHSLGGPTQTYAIAYIQKHCPTFFDLIRPRNFITLASPMLGVSGENPLYVRLALEAGLVGRSGRDLGLSWGPKTIARSGWGALVASLAGGGGGGTTSPNTSSSPPPPPPPQRPGSKPLMQILPTGPAHDALAKFANRTVYANVVNDGIVPLRTSSLLFLDWQSLDRIERARRDTGLMTNVGRHILTQVQQQQQQQQQRRPPLPTRRHHSDQDLSTVPQPTDAEAADIEGDGLPPLAPAKARTGLSPNRGPPALAGFFKLRKANSNKNSSRESSPDRFVPLRHKQMLSRGQTFHFDDLPSAERTDLLLGAEPQQRRREAAEIRAPPTTTFLEGFGDVLTPVVPVVDFLVDPESRPKTIIHDRLYRPADIPPTPEGDMRVEERVARSYHRDMSWRKVLVKIEPDAHNNIIVRRKFSNAQGWPVIKHLVDTHFARGNDDEDEEEPMSPVKPPLPPRTYSQPMLQLDRMEPDPLLSWCDADWQDSEDSDTDEDGGRLRRLAAHFTTDGMKA